MAYDIGDGIELTCTFTTTAGVAADPENVFFRLKAPQTAVAVFTYGEDAEVTKVSTGVYKFASTAAKGGKHYYAWIASGTVASVAQGDFYVDWSRA